MTLDEEVAALKERVEHQDAVIRFMMSWLSEVHKAARLSGTSTTLFGVILRPVMRAIPSSVASAVVASGVSPAEALAMVAKELPALSDSIEAAMATYRLLRKDVTWTDIGLTVASRMENPHGR